MNRLTLRQSTTTIAARLGMLLAAASLALAGCTTAGASDAGGDTGDSASAASAGQGMTISDGWVKAAESGMSAGFGRLTNEGAEDATVVSATTEASSMIELHETVENETGEMTMREIDGGFVIPAGGTLSLEPGGNHIMLMDLTAPLEAGDEVTFTLTFSDDSTYEFTAPVKDYSGANENYDGGGSESDGSETDGAEMDMGDAAGADS